MLYGHLLELDSGVLVYMARRKHREIFRGGRGTISAAMQGEVAAWAIDEKLLIGLRAKRVAFIGVNVIDVGDRYLTRLSEFFDRRKAKLLDFTGVGRGGSRQLYLPLQYFYIHKGKAELDIGLLT